MEKSLGNVDADEIDETGELSQVLAHEGLSGCDVEELFSGPDDI